MRKTHIRHATDANPAGRPQPTNHYMLHLHRLAPVVFCLAALSITPHVHADESDVLLRVLVRKGILTEKEAVAVRSEVAKEKAKEAPKPVTASASTGDGGLLSKLDISKSIEKLKLYGDMRLRYQYETRDAQFEPGLGINNRQHRSASGSQESRFRFRLRLNADYRFTDDIFAGVELQTNNANDSANQTFENGFNDYDIFISRAYLGWDATKWLRVVGGKMPSYFYNTDLMWDPDINPTGAFESIAFHKLGEEQFESSLDKDGKTVSKPVTKPWELTFNAGQFIFDNNPEGAFDHDSGTDAWLFYSQLVGAYRFAHDVKVTLAPGYMTYINGSLSGVNNARGFNDNAFVSGATRNLNLLLLPGDVSFKLGSLKAKLYWDLSYNIEGRKRVENIYDIVSLASPENDPDDLRKGHSNVDDLAFVVGLKLGENNHAGDWSLQFDYRQIGLGSVDPNLNDSDIFASALNMRGFRLRGEYNFTDFLSAGFQYTYGWNLRQNLIGGEATGGNAVADTNDIHTAIFDLQLKF
jgi:hypothetical protein